MTFLEAASSGVVQGATEFLPISSSGHLVLLHAFFGFQKPRLLFDLCLHLGTTTATILFFWPRILSLTKEKKLLFFIFLSFSATAAIGLFFGKFFERFFVQPSAVGWAFLATAIFLFSGECRRPARERGEGEMTWGSALLIGISQGVAILPGLSRSGLTIATGLLLGFRKAFAVRYSFLLLIPTVLGAFLYKIFSEEEALSSFRLFLEEEGVMALSGSVIALGVGLLTIPLVTRMAEKGKLFFFSLYLAGLGISTLFLFGRTPP